jgi:hypothetical protein
VLSPEIDDRGEVEVANWANVVTFFLRSGSKSIRALQLRPFVKASPPGAYPYLSYILNYPFSPRFATTTS